MTALLTHYDTVLMSNLPIATQGVVSKVAAQYNVSYGVAAELILLAAKYNLSISEFTGKG